MVAAPSGSVSARARAETVRSAVEVRPVVHPVGVGDAAGGEARGEGPVTDHGRGEGHPDELAVGLVVEVVVGGFGEQCAGPFGILAGERLGERDEALVDEPRHAGARATGEPFGRDGDGLVESPGVTQRRRGSGRGCWLRGPSCPHAGDARRLRGTPRRRRPTRPSTLRAPPRCTGGVALRSRVYGLRAGKACSTPSAASL